MKTVKEQLAKSLKQVLKKWGYSFKETFINISYPKISLYGDYTTNIAMKLAKELGEPANTLAEKIIAKLRAAKTLKSIFAEIKVERPGFINFYLSKEFLNQQAAYLLSLKRDLGQRNIGKKKKVQIEFISANPTGPLTIGNGRGGFYGDALGNVLKKCGFRVVKEYLINDAGKQIEALGHSVLKDEQAVYHGNYIDELHQRFCGRKDFYKVGQEAAEIILEKYIKHTIEAKMKIKFDVWFSEERELRKTGAIEKILTWLKRHGHLYEKAGAWWFKSSVYGDSRDRVLIKGNGEFTYLAQDFAYLRNKFTKRKFDKVINVWGADHQGDVAGLLNAAKVLGYEGKQEVILQQFVRLIKDGKEMRMSKRAGNYVTIDELINEVGHDAVRFIFLMFSPSTHIDFNLDLAKERSNKNPVYYVQYAYARIASLLRQPELKVDTNQRKKPTEIYYKHPAELDLIKEVIKWPEILEEISQTYQVQLLPEYAIGLADKFHQFYDQCRIISQGQVNWSRVKLVYIIRKVLSEILGIIGVSAPEKM